MEGQVVWDDAHNQDGVRPSAVRLAARQAGATVLTCSIEGEAGSDEWAWNTQGLPVYMPDKQGEAITYSVAAADAIGYDAPAVNESEDGSWVVTYHRDPQTVDVAGIVSWDDNNNRDAIRPDSVGVMLWRDGKAYMGTQVASAKDGWTYDFSKMPRYEGEGNERHEIQYSVTASKVDKYDWSAERFDVTYTHAPATTATHVTQIWNDGDNADGLRLDLVGVSLYANGTPTGKSLTLSADGGWASEFDAMPKYDQGVPIVYSVEVEGSAADELRARGYSVKLVSYGEDVPKDAYEAQAGSVVIKLKPAYLEKLKDGSHTIVANFNDGSAQARFAIEAAPASNASDSFSRRMPNTSDPLLGSASLLLLAAGAALCLAVAVRRRVK